MNKTLEIVDYIKSYPRKHKEGYSNVEIISICEHYQVNSSRVYEKLFRTSHGVEVKNGDVIYDEDDVCNAFASVL